jgi:RimJ/RimL family protein N-acetyltransferase
MRPSTPEPVDRQPTLEGETLLLRPLREGDWDALYAVASDPKVWEQHPIPDRWHEEVFRGYFQDAIAAGGALVASLRREGRVVGCSQFRPTAFDPDGIEVGWTFVARDRWGTGTNPEMKRLMLTHAFESVPRVLFRIGETNLRSRTAIERIGGNLTDLVEDSEYRGKPLRHVVYEITRESFAAGPLSA